MSITSQRDSLFSNMSDGVYEPKCPKCNSVDIVKIDQKRVCFECNAIYERDGREWRECPRKIDGESIKPIGAECIAITEHMRFCLGTAIEYIWRGDGRGNDVEDLNRAIWYISREIARREKK